LRKRRNGAIKKEAQEKKREKKRTTKKVTISSFFSAINLEIVFNKKHLQLEKDVGNW
jgi:hypothetical protein